MTLRIQKSTDGGSSVFHVIGRLEVKNVPELQKLIDTGTGRIVLELGELRLADRESIEFLTRAEAVGVRITHCPEHIREWISKTKLSRK